jgi:putative flippase GtrA
VLISTQAQRFVRVGIVSNGLCYGCFLTLLWSGLVGHVNAMTAAYCLGVILSFLFNKVFTSEHQGRFMPALVRFIALYLSGYLINLWLLRFLVDSVGWAAAVAQLLVIVMLAVYFFFMQRLIVFRS